MYNKLNSTILKIGFLRVFVIFLNFFTTAYLINTLGNESYGIYITLFSVLTWVFILDLGVGKGMRNKLTDFLVEKDKSSAKKIVSTAFGLSITFSLMFFVAYLITVANIDVVSFLNIETDNVNSINNAILVFVLVICFKLIFGNLNQILYCFHLSHINVLITLLISLLFIVLLKLHSAFEIQLSFVTIAVSYFIAVITSFFGVFIWFFTKHKYLTPSVKSFSKEFVKLILGSGLKILAIQILFFLLLSLDRFFLLKFIDAESVTKYDVIYKVMTLLLFPFSIIAQPLWSSYAEASKRKDFKWIRKIIKKLYLFSIVVVFGIFVLTFLFDQITYLWLGKTIEANIYDKLLLGLLIFLIMWSTMHSDMLLGFSKYRFMAITVAIGFTLKMVTIYYFIYIDELNLLKLIATSILGYFFFCFSAPFVVKKIISKNESIC